MALFHWILNCKKNKYAFGLHKYQCVLVSVSVVLIHRIFPPGLAEVGHRCWRGRRRCNRIWDAKCCLARVPKMMRVCLMLSSLLQRRHSASAVNTLRAAAGASSNCKVNLHANPQPRVITASFVVRSRGPRGVDGASSTASATRQVISTPAPTATPHRSTPPSPLPTHPPPCKIPRSPLPPPPSYRIEVRWDAWPR